MTALMSAVIAAAACALVAFFAIKYALGQRKIRVAAEGLLEEYYAGEKLRAQLAQKTEVIKHEQAADKAKVDTGDPVADFSGSLDVLSDRSRRRKG